MSEQMRYAPKEEQQPDMMTEEIPYKESDVNLDEIDKMLDEIDEVLEENAADFVAAFQQRGGQ